MNIAQINAIRASANLPALAVDTAGKAAAKKREAANKAKRAQASRDLKDARARNKK